MAQYRLSASIISRSTGRSSVAAAAYRSATKMYDDRTGLFHDYTRKSGVLHTEIMMPDTAPEWMKDRAALWNAVEKIERRRDAQLSREIQLSLPYELTIDDNRELLLRFVKEQFVDQGMIADVAIHAPDRYGDQRNVHSHIMLTTRTLLADGFGKKNRDWNSPETLTQWREQWAQYQNRELERRGLDIRVDHRSYEEQGIDKQPTQHLGAVANDMERKGKGSRIGDENRTRIAENEKRLALAQESAQTTAKLAAARKALTEKQLLQRVQFDNYYRDEEIALGRKHDRACALLKQDQQKRNGGFLKELESRQQEIEQRLAVKGVRKFVRNISGMSARDEQAKLAIEKTLTDMRAREAEELRALERRKDIEKQALETKKEIGRQRLEQQLAPEGAKVAEKVKQGEKPFTNDLKKERASNDLKQPVWQRSAAPEQQNQTVNKRSFDDVSKAQDVPLNGKQMMEEWKQANDGKEQRQGRLQQSPEKPEPGQNAKDEMMKEFQNRSIPGLDRER